MKNTWDRLGADLHTVQDELEILLEMMPLSTKFHKQTTTINKAWIRLQASVKLMDTFVIPVKSVEINSPLLKDAEFAATWKFWKDYLIEQHGIHARSRTELMQLKQMLSICEGNATTAVSFLEYAMYRGTKSFFKVNETELAKMTPSNTVKKDEKAMVISLPSKYKQITLEEAIITAENEQQLQKTPK